MDLIGRVPTILHPIGRAYSGVEGTAFYRAMQSGKYSYRMYCFIRSEASGNEAIRTPPPLASASTTLPKALLLRLTWIPRVTQFLAKYLYPFITRLVSKDDVSSSTTATRRIADGPAPGCVRRARSVSHSGLPPHGYPGGSRRQTGVGGQLRARRRGLILTRTVQPASYTGVDLNPTGVNFCRKRHNVPGLDFVQGDAEKLLFADESFDAVINVGASHCYVHCPRFLAEVARMLRPGGHFLYTDLRSREGVAHWEAGLPTHRCGCFRVRSSMSRLSAGWGTIRSVAGPVRIPAACQISGFCTA